MKFVVISVTCFLCLHLLAIVGIGQIDEICAESGLNPSLDSPFAHTPYVYGRVTLKGFAAGKSSQVTVVLIDGGTERTKIERSGNYCFKRKSSGGAVAVEVDGLEVTRRQLPGFGTPQQREDFEIASTPPETLPPAAVVSAKFSHPPNEKTAELYKKTLEAERNNEPTKAIEYLKEIVAIDTADFIAWAKLGSLFFAASKFPEADDAFRKSLELRVDYTPAWINVGQMRVAQKQYEAAIGIFQHVTDIEPTSARAFQLLGESYLLAKKGSLAVVALNNAIELDPIGMAQCHLQMARLYELAGAKQLAVNEYKRFLEKMPNHPDRKKFEKFIKDNSK